jgi:hypothetical protein
LFVRRFGFSAAGSPYSAQSMPLWHLQAARMREEDRVRAGLVADTALWHCYGWEKRETMERFEILGLGKSPKNCPRRWTAMRPSGAERSR